MASTLLSWGETLRSNFAGGELIKSSPVKTCHKFLSVAYSCLDQREQSCQNHIASHGIFVFLVPFVIPHPVYEGLECLESDMLHPQESISSDDFSDIQTLLSSWRCIQRCRRERLVNRPSNHEQEPMGPFQKQVINCVFKAKKKKHGGEKKKCKQWNKSKKRRRERITMAKREN